MRHLGILTKPSPWCDAVVLGVPTTGPWVLGTAQWEGHPSMSQGNSLVRKVRKPLSPSGHLSKDTLQNTKLSTSPRGSHTPGKWGRSTNKSPDARLTSALLAAQLAVQLLWSFKLNYLGFDYCSKSLDKGGTPG